MAVAVVMKIRLDKYLADMGLGARSQVKKEIRDGGVTVNGAVTRRPETKIDTEQDEIAFHGEPVAYTEYEYYMLNKPAGVVSASSDRQETTVIDLIGERKRNGLFPIGRLDKDTEGLLIITNNGELAHRLLSPKKHVDKVYFARIKGYVTETDVENFSRGVDIGDEKPTLPAELFICRSDDISEIRLTIREGGEIPSGETHVPGGRKGSRLPETAPDGPRHAGRRPDAGRVPQTDRRRGRKIMLTGKKAVIFDMDGSLVDSMWIWPEVDRIYMDKYHLTEPPTFHRDIEGMSYTETAQYFVDTFADLDRTVAQVMQEWRDMTIHLYATKVFPKPGAVEFLKDMKRRGIALGIATSNDRSIADAALNARHLAPYFDSVRTSCEVSAGKPAPDVYLKVAEDLHVEPSSCLVFEDIPNGILAGKNAGMEVCAVDDEFSRPLEKEKKQLADYFIRDFHDIFRHTYERCDEQK